MKKISILFLGILFLSGVTAQEADTTKAWTKGGKTSLTFSQVSLTNWSAGGENSLSANAFINLFANYAKGKSSWENSLEMGYGLVKLGDEDVRKSDDKLNLSSKYGYKASKSWNYAALFDFRSQFTDGYDYPNDSIPISRFLAPAYISLGIGMDYKPAENFSIYLSPLTGRLLIVNDQDLADAGAFGVDPATYDENMNKLSDGENLKTEFGAMLKLEYNKDLIENVNFQTKLELFSNYLENPQNIDINWEVFINMKINKFLSANIQTHLIYDDDIDIMDKDGNKGPRTQFKEVFGLGVAYNF